MSAALRSFQGLKMLDESLEARVPTQVVAQADLERLEVCLLASELTNSCTQAGFSVYSPQGTAKRILTSPLHRVAGR